MTIGINFELPNHNLLSSQFTPPHNSHESQIFSKSGQGKKGLQELISC